MIAAPAAPIRDRHPAARFHLEKPLWERGNARRFAIRTNT